MKNYNPDNKTVLIVEDDADFRETEVKFFQKAGFNTVTSENGLEALNKTQLQEFDLIICDITMPKMTGDAAISHIRQSVYNKNTPIIVLSGYLDAETVNKVKGKISKAFTKPADLMEVVTFAKQLTS